MNIYKLGVKLFGKELRHDEKFTNLTNSMVAQNMPKDLTINKELRHDEGVAKLIPSLVNKYMAHRE